MSDEERRLFIAGSILCVCDQEKRRLDKVSRALFAAPAYKKRKKQAQLFTLILEIFRLTQARQNRILQALPLKCAVRIFRTSATCRTSEGGKCEFLRVRRARDLDALPQKERKPRLKKTILRRNRVPPQRAMVRYIRGVVFEWRGCRSKSEKSRGRKSSKLFHPHPRDFSLIPGKCRQVAPSAPASAPRRARRRRRRAWARKKVPKGG